MLMLMGGGVLSLLYRMDQMTDHLIDDIMVEIDGGTIIMTIICDVTFDGMVLCCVVLCGLQGKATGWKEKLWS